MKRYSIRYTHVGCEKVQNAVCRKETFADSKAEAEQFFYDLYGPVKIISITEVV